MNTTPSSTCPFDPPLLDMLLRADGHVDVGALSEQLSMSSQQIAGQLQRLRDAGCVIETHPQHGPKLIRSSLGVWVDYLGWARLVTGDKTTRHVELYKTTSSTQDAARRIVEQHGPDGDGAIAIADEQTAGRGRLGRQWLAPPGSAVLFTRATVRTTMEQLPSMDHLAFAASVAVAQAIEAATRPHALTVTIKWPNDILVDGQKLAGILVETFSNAHAAVLIGVGINCDWPADQMPDELRGHATSLAMCGCEVDRLLVLSETIQQLDRAMHETDLDELVCAWRSRCAVLSKWVTLQTSGQTFRGQVIDLDPYQGLIVRTDDGAMVHLPAATTTIL